MDCDEEGGKEEWGSVEVVVNSVHCSVGAEAAGEEEEKEEEEKEEEEEYTSPLCGHD